MIQRIKIIMTSAVMSGLLFLPVAIVPAVHAADSLPQAVCQGASLTVSNAATGGGTCANAQSDHLNNVIKLVLNLISIIVGIVAVIMIVIGGLKYVLSGGDSNRVSGAKDTILFAIVGLIVVVLAQVIVHFVLSNANTAVSTGS